MAAAMWTASSVDRAAPFGGWIVKHVPARGLMTAVGCLIVVVSIFQLLRAFKVI